jgi:hypothetical protein
LTASICDFGISISSLAAGSLPFNEVALYDRTPMAPALHIDTINYDKAGLGRNTSTKVFLEKNGNDFAGIKLNGELLVEGKDYTLNQARIDFTRDYLDSLDVGKYVFDEAMV